MGVSGKAALISKSYVLTRSRLHATLEMSFTPLSVHRIAAVKAYLDLQLRLSQIRGLGELLIYSHTT